jgi:hypothetical protein
MLGALLALGIFGGAAAKAAYDNYNMKKYSTRYDENGNRHYFDRLGTDYINGEKIISGGYTDTKGIYHRTETGLNSNKVYTDYVCPSEQLKADYQKEEIQWAKDHNVLIANIYQPRFKKAVATELSTGKVIACMMDYKVNGVEHYRKFYVKPDAKEYEYNKTAKGDMGIEITKDEYYKMFTVPPTYSCLPSDYDVVNALYADK